MTGNPADRAAARGVPSSGRRGLAKGALATTGAALAYAAPVARRVARAQRVGSPPPVPYPPPMPVLSAVVTPPRGGPGEEPTRQVILVLGFVAAGDVIQFTVSTLEVAGEPFGGGPTVLPPMVATEATVSRPTINVPCGQTPARFLLAATNLTTGVSAAQVTVTVTC